MIDSIMQLATEVMADQLKAQSAPKAASERATPEPAGPAKVVAAVATGSLPVSSAEALIEKWRTAALYSSYRLAQAALNSCADDLRRELERANVRQPEENVAGQPRPANAKSL